MRKILVILAIVILPMGSISFGAYKGKPPDQVVSAGESAENLVDLYQKKKWMEAGKLLDDFENKAPVVASALRREMSESAADDFNYLLYSLRELSRERQPLRAALAANQVTGLIIGLEGRYSSPLPREIPRMDYLGRDVVILAELGSDGRLLRIRKTELLRAWRIFKSGVSLEKAEKNSALITDVDTIVRTIVQAKTAALTIKKGKLLLDQVDQLEAAFR